MIYFPMGPAFVMSTAVRAGYKCDLLDGRVDAISEEDLELAVTKKTYDVIAIGELTHTYFIIKPLLKKLKELTPKSVIVVGNSIASAHPELLLFKTQADIAVHADGIETFVDLLSALGSGSEQNVKNVSGISYRECSKIVTTARRPPVQNMDSIQYPDWDLFNCEAYIRSAQHYHNPAALPILIDGEMSKQSPRSFPINYTRGCPFRCTFCYESLYHEYQPLGSRSPDYLIREIQHLKEKFNLTFLWFWDELTFYSAKQAEPFVNAMLKADLGISWVASVRVGFLKERDKDFADKLKKSGCVQLSYSLESGSPKIIEAMNKKIKIDDFYTTKNVLDDAGILSNTNLVLGYPEETQETLDETFGVCSKAEIFPSAGFLLPVPGTIMWNRAVDEGYIKDQEKFILSVRDRQNLLLNMTSMPDEVLVRHTVNHMRALRDQLNLDLPDENLIENTKLNKEAAGHPLV